MVFLQQEASRCHVFVWIVRAAKRRLARADTQCVLCSTFTACLCFPVYLCALGPVFLRVFACICTRTCDAMPCGHSLPHMTLYVRAADGAGGIMGRQQMVAGCEGFLVQMQRTSPLMTVCCGWWLVAGVKVVLGGLPRTNVEGMAFGDVFSCRPKTQVLQQGNAPLPPALLQHAKGDTW